MTEPAGDSTRANGALALAAAALLVALYSAFGGHGGDAHTAAAPVGSAVVDREARDEIEKLHRENAVLRDQLLASLETRVARLEGPTAATKPTASAAPPATADTPPPGLGKDAGMRYAKLVSPSPLVVVREGRNGSISVQNGDPALTGKTLTIDAVGTDGTREKIKVVVPPP
jgi:hypothetical protein